MNNDYCTFVSCFLHARLIYCCVIYLHQVSPVSRNVSRGQFAEPLLNQLTDYPSQAERSLSICTSNVPSNVTVAG